MKREADPEAIVIEHKRDIVERSDFDRDQTVNAEEFGEDWGDGFHVDLEPVLVTRGADGEIVRTTPMSEVEWAAERAAEARVEPVLAPVHISPTPVSPSQREKIVRVLAVRMFKEYAGRSPEDTRYNPIYDGIPDVPPGPPANLQPLPGTKFYYASNDQVLEWLKTNVIGARAQVINKRIGDGYVPTLSFDRG